MNSARLRTAVQALTRVADGRADESAFLEEAEAILADLLAHDDWLPDRYAEPSAERYRQYLLYCDPKERFSVVSFVWLPGQSTPIHNHEVWGLVGVLRGRERSIAYTVAGDGSLVEGADVVARPGEIGRVSPTIGDIHRVSSATETETTVSIHIYGGNIGRIARSAFDPDGARRPFVGRFANDSLPNIWNE